MRILSWVNHHEEYLKSKNILFIGIFLFFLLYLVWHFWSWKPSPPQPHSSSSEKKKKESFITSARVPPEIDGYFYKGCWTENPDQRALTNYLGQGTVEDCVRLAKSFNYDTVALTDNNHCWGGNHGQFQNNYQKYGQLNDLIGCDFVAPENDANLVYSKSVLGDVQENDSDSDQEGQKKKKENVTNIYYNFYDTPSAEDFDDRLIVDAHKQMEAWKPPYPEYPFPPSELNEDDADMMQGYAEIPPDLDYMTKEGMINIQGETKDVFTQVSPSTFDSNSNVNNSSSSSLLSNSSSSSPTFPIQMVITQSPSASLPPPLNPNAGISFQDAKMLYVGKANDYLLKKNVPPLSCQTCGYNLESVLMTKEGGGKKKKSCPTCPPCPRCPPPDFECKQIPAYTTTSYDNIPAPQLATFKSFGMG